MKNKIKDTDSFIHEANIVHNNKFNYSLVNYKKSKENIIIICPEHGEFNSTPDNHIRRKSGCPYCSKNKSNNLLFIKKSKCVHGEIYDYSKVKYEKHRSVVTIICPTHGDFLQTPDSHLQGSGCIYCFKNMKTTIKNFINKSNNKHEYKYDYSIVSKIKNNTSKITIICPNHGKFQQQVRHHMSGSGCPSCNESKGEREIGKILKENNIMFEIQKTFNKCKNKETSQNLKFDFYLPNFNACIEFDGIQHFEPVKYFGGEKAFKGVQKRDKIKDEYCKENNIRLIRIKHSESILKSLEKYILTI